MRPITRHFNQLAEFKFLNWTRPLLRATFEPGLRRLCGEQRKKTHKGMAILFNRTREEKRVEYIIYTCSEVNGNLYIALQATFLYSSSKHPFNSIYFTTVCISVVHFAVWWKTNEITERFFNLSFLDSCHALSWFLKSCLQN